MGDRWTLWPLDCRIAMASMMAAESVDSIITDPPYHLTSITDRVGKPGSAPIQFGTDGAFRRAAAGFMGMSWDGHEFSDFDPGFGHWLAGFADGEGCFVTRKNGAGFLCEFVIHLRADDIGILKQIQGTLGIGKVTGPTRRADGPNPMAKWVVTRQADCAKLCSIFDVFPLRAKKHRDFLLWKESVQLWIRHEPGTSWDEMADYSRRMSEIKLYGSLFNQSQFFHYQWAKGAFRVLKPGGYLIAFGGPRTYHRLAAAIEDAGFEIRDQIAWVFGSGFPKSHALAEREGWGTALKPALEPIVVARKPLIGSVAANVLAYGTGAINIDGCRVPGGESTVRTNTAEMGYHGGNLAAEYQTGSPLGRWPANLIHDGSDEVIALFPGQAGAAAPVHRRGADKFRNTYGAFKGDIDETGSTYRGDSGSAARFFYCAKASKADREEGCAALALQTAGMVSDHSGQHITRRDEGYELPKRANHHPTVKPTDLMRYLCRMHTPPGGLILDPFTGSGSTGKAAMLEGFRFVGCEMTPAYIPIAEARIRHAAASGGS